MWRHEADKPAAGQHGHVNAKQQEVQEKKRNQRKQKRGQYREVHDRRNIGQQMKAPLFLTLALDWGEWPI
jgi:predicted 2-oxoglutarate/Fe(II)-dependent dioxygenase YbiX